MFEKLKAVEARYEDVSAKLADSAVINDPEQLKKLMKEHKSLSPVVEKYREYISVKKNCEEAKALLDSSGSDKDLR